VAAPGLEEVVEAEVRALDGIGAVAREGGGVSFRAPLAEGAAANLRLRVASRLLLRLGEVRAQAFGPLRRGLARLPWEAFVPRDRPLKVTASATRSRLYHTGALAETVALAVRDRMGPLPASGPSADEVTRLSLRGERDVFVASVDASGELLHRRGGRVETGAAPVRETLAAGVLALGGYDPARPLVDVMCGAGTFALEAAAIALSRAPGLARAFACERWPCWDRASFARLRAEAEAGARDRPPAAIVACDVDSGALAIARRNAERAGVAPHVELVEAALGAWRPPAGPGLVVLNPPYGRRLAAPGGARPFFRDVGRHLRAAFAGWRAAVLLPDERLAPLVGLRAETRHRLFHGGLRIVLVVGDVAAGRPESRA
jgi:putative N6-adenine-specific DNA methylase